MVEWHIMGAPKRRSRGLGRPRGRDLDRVPRRAHLLAALIPRPPKFPILGGIRWMWCRRILFGPSGSANRKYPWRIRRQISKRVEAGGGAYHESRTFEQIPWNETSTCFFPSDPFCCRYSRLWLRRKMPCIYRCCIDDLHHTHGINELDRSRRNGGFACFRGGLG